MNHKNGKKHNLKIIKLVKKEIHKPRLVYLTGHVFTVKRFNPPSYKHVCFELNSRGYTTTRGNSWTPQRLFRMLQRNGYSGLYGAFHKG
jgi:tRNA G26 N,N-dimethylase Trm1